MKSFPKNTIVATIGPATHTPEIITQLIKEGVGIFRLHMGYRDHAFHHESVAMIKSANAHLGTETLILCDLGGPRIRLGDFENDGVVISEGNTFTFFVTHCLGNEQQAFIDYANLHKEIKPGALIFAHDGKRKFQVESVTENSIITKIVAGGKLRNKAGINMPGANLSIPSLTEKDKDDISFGIEAGVDLFAVSFVRKVGDMTTVREILLEQNCDAGLVSKIETPEALENIDGIIDASDAIMVARGDLAIEIGYEYVPRAQKMIIKKCNEKNKFVIVATDMMDSMKAMPVPTRAEVSDVANAILDGADAVMTSIETVIGEYPIETVKWMKKIIDVYKK